MINNQEPIQKRAKRLHALGANVVPVRGKVPFWDWKTAMDARQTEQDVAALPWSWGDGIGVINGVNDWRTIDIDAVPEQGADRKRPVPKDVCDAILARLGLPADYPWCWPSLSGAGWHIHIRVPSAPDEPQKATAHFDPREEYADAFRQIELHWTTRQTSVPPAVNLPAEPPHIVELQTVRAALDAVAVPQRDRTPAQTQQIAPLSAVRKGNAAERLRRYGDAALERMVDELRHAPVGTRNNTLNGAAYRAGRLIAAGAIDEDEARRELADAARQAGLSAHEVEKTLASGLGDGIAAGPADIADRPMAGGHRRNGATPHIDGADAEGGEDGAQRAKRLSQAQIMLSYCADWTLIVSPLGDTYAGFIDDSGVRRTRPIRGRGGVRSVLHVWYTNQHNAPPSADAISSVIETLDSRAIEFGEKADVHRRFAASGDGRTIWIDRGVDDPDGAYIEIDAAGWRLTNNPGAHLVRSPGMLPLPKPERSGSIDLLRSYVNADEGTWRLIAAWLLAALMPEQEGTRAHLVLTGEQGSAKTTLARLLKRIIDPHRAVERGPVRDERDLMVAARHSAVLVYDNVSSIPEWLSDALCRLASGGAFATRELYTDHDETLFWARRPVILTGIGDIVTRPDLLDRCIVATLNPIPDSERKPENDINADFAQHHARILGALCDAVSAALRHRDAIRLGTLPRMADAARWVAAGVTAWGWNPHAIVDDLTQARMDAARDLLDNDAVAMRLVELAECAGGTWQGSITDLLHKLRDGATPELERDLPSSARSLGKKLARIAPELRRVGWNIERERSEHARMVLITKLSDARQTQGAPASTTCPMPEPKNLDLKTNNADLKPKNPDLETNNVDLEPKPMPEPEPPAPEPQTADLEPEPQNVDLEPPPAREPVPGIDAPNYLRAVHHAIAWWQVNRRTTVYDLIACNAAGAPDEAGGWAKLVLRRSRSDASPPLRAPTRDDLVALADEHIAAVHRRAAERERAVAEREREIEEARAAGKIVSLEELLQRARDNR